jgi:tetratricopeptide (TPR) repeat protein
MNVALVLIALIAGADAPDPRAVALFEKAAQDYEAENYDAALKGFSEAHRISNEPVLLLNIGQCHRKLGNHEQAVSAFEAYLKAVPDAEDRAEVEELLAEERTFLKKPDGPKRDEFKMPELGPPKVDIDETTLWAVGGAAAGVLLVAAGITIAVIASQPPPPLEPTGTLGVVEIP